MEGGIHLKRERKKGKLKIGYDGDKTKETVLKGDR